MQLEHRRFGVFYLLYGQESAGNAKHLGTMEA